MTLFTYIFIGIFAGMMNSYLLLGAIYESDWLIEHDTINKIVKVLAIIVAFVFWPIPIAFCVLYWVVLPIRMLWK